MCHLPLLGQGPGRMVRAVGVLSAQPPLFVFEHCPHCTGKREHQVSVHAPLTNPPHAQQPVSHSLGPAGSSPWLKGALHVHSPAFPPPQTQQSS